MNRNSSKEKRLNLVQKLFRRLRRKLIEEGNFKRYLLYAAGEILLIVIGILLALQINNWNEHRKKINSERQYLRRLLVEIRLDSLTLSEEIKTIKMRNEQIANFTQMLNRKTANDSLLVASAYNYFGSGWYLPSFPVSTSTFDDLSSTGQLNIIQKADLRNLLVQKYSSYKETGTKFNSNREWLNSIDAGLTAKLDVLKFDPKTDQLFEKQSIKIKVQQLRREKNVYVRNAAVHFWVNESSIALIEMELMEVSKLIEVIKKELQD